jgi:hypothetical protein
MFYAVLPLGYVMEMDLVSSDLLSDSVIILLGGRLFRIYLAPYLSLHGPSMVTWWSPLIRCSVHYARGNAKRPQ